MNKMEMLHIGKATDIEEPKERRLYRLLEMVQGGLAWVVLFLSFVLSWLAPGAVLYFLLFFVVLFLALSIYYMVHLVSGFRKMEEHKKIDWMSRVRKIEGWEEVYHLITFPNYKEPIDVLRQSLKAVAESDYPKDKMIVVLAFEGRAGDERKEISKQLKEEFGDTFFRLISTFHPDGLEGEIKGKSSNDAWAAARVRERVIDKLKIPYDKIIYSSFDSDTQAYPKYFSCVAYHFLTVEKPTRTSYQPIPLYNNNIWEAPSFSKTTALTNVFWETICQERPEKLTSFSSHSMSFKALVDVGYKQKNMVNEDSRIFWQCFFKYDGDYRTQPIYYPVSLDANVGPNIWSTIKQVYKQQKRWGYPENTAYFLYHSLKNKKVPLKEKLSHGIELVFGTLNWAVSSVLISTLGWLPILLGGTAFGQSLLSYAVPKMVGRIMTFSMLGLVTSIWLSFVILPPRPKRRGWKKYLFLILSWFLVPVQMLLLGTLPVLHAQTRLMLGKYMGFWVTPKSR